jgi:hypothetical protein
VTYCAREVGDMLTDQSCGLSPLIRQLAPGTQRAVNLVAYITEGAKRSARRLGKSNGSYLRG